MEPSDAVSPSAEKLKQLTLAVEKRERELSILSEVASRVHGQDDVDSILGIALDEMLAQMGLETAWILMADEAEGPLCLVASRGVSPAYLEETRIHGLPECLCPEVFRSGQMMQARNTTQCPRMPMIMGGSEIRAHACIPLRFEGESRGVLNVAARPGERFAEEELRFLETLGHQVCIAVERAIHRNRQALRDREAHEGLKMAQQRAIQAERMAVLGTFASGLAHEVRNPLNSIGLQLSLLERRVLREGGLREELRDLFRVIRQEILRLDSLVGDFLLFSRTSQIHRRPTDLDEVIEEVVRLFEPLAEERGLILRTNRIGPRIPPLPLDGEKMKQVLINLLQNAIEAPPRSRVWLESGVVGGRAQIVVRDDGPGLPEGVDVFQLFVTTKPQGSGLGLPIAQQIVLDHGGEVVASGGSEGAAFTISLPLAAG